MKKDIPKQVRDRLQAVRSQIATLKTEQAALEAAVEVLKPIDQQKQTRARKKSETGSGRKDTTAPAE